MTNRRMHSADFKRDAIQLARTNGNLSGTARDLGINASLLPDRHIAGQAALFLIVALHLERLPSTFSSDCGTWFRPVDQ